MKPRQPLSNMVPIPAEGILKDERERMFLYLSLWRGLFIKAENLAIGENHGS